MLLEVSIKAIVVIVIILILAYRFIILKYLCLIFNYMKSVFDEVELNRMWSTKQRDLDTLKVEFLMKCNKLLIC